MLEICSAVNVNGGDGPGPVFPTNPLATFVGGHKGNVQVGLNVIDQIDSDGVQVGTTGGLIDAVSYGGSCELGGKMFVLTGFVDGSLKVNYYQVNHDRTDTRMLEALAVHPAYGSRGGRADDIGLFYGGGTGSRTISRFNVDAVQLSNVTGTVSVHEHSAFTLGDIMGVFGDNNETNFYHRYNSDGSQYGTTTNVGTGRRLPGATEIDGCGMVVGGIGGYQVVTKLTRDGVMAFDETSIGEGYYRGFGCARSDDKVLATGSSHGGTNKVIRFTGDGLVYGAYTTAGWDRMEPMAEGTF